jgi:putative intracellular protease/amidase
MEITFAVFPGFTALDLIGPYEVVARLPGTSVQFAAAESGPVADSRGVIEVPAARSFAEVSRPEVVVVPGGAITRRMVRDGHPLIDWLREVHPHTRFTTSVCTGSLLLGAAGVLDGLEATSYWVAREQLADFGATPLDERVVERGRVITGAGVSSGIDMALLLVARLAGEEAAQIIQLAIEYDPAPPFDAGSPATASPAIVAAVRARVAANLAAASA